MSQPTISDFDDWYHHPITKWYFQYVQENADGLAGANGRQIGLMDSEGIDHMTAVRMAGFVAGMEDVINHDPFVEEREERQSVDED